MNIVLRVDASSQVGIGHVMRCLTLAEKLVEKQATVYFVCKESPGNLIEFIRKKGFVCHVLADLLNRIQDAEETIAFIINLSKAIDWLIIDHYSIDDQWEKTLRPFVRNIFVIDDLANRSHDCDLLLDQNYYEQAEKRYLQLVPSSCKCFFGPRYALLREQFLEARKHIRRRSGYVQRIFVFFGGSDPTGETIKTLKALKLLAREDIAIDVVVGSSNARKDEVASYCVTMKNVRYFCQYEQMAFLMAQSDLAIGAGGTATWERMCVGLPTITVIVADNQLEVTNALDKDGLIWNLGYHKDVKITDIYNKIREALMYPDKLLRMEKLSYAIMNIQQEDGKTAIANYMLGALR